MSVLTSDLSTVGDIARHLGEPSWRIAYVIETRGIEPITRVGGYRVFDRAAVKAISDALATLDKQRQPVSK